MKTRKDGRKMVSGNWAWLLFGVAIYAFTRRATDTPASSASSSSQAGQTNLTGDGSNSIAAELEAARIAAELEAARIAAELEAARIAAELEAERIEADRIEADRIEADRIAEQERIMAEAYELARQQERAEIAANIAVLESQLPGLRSRADAMQRQYASAQSRRVRPSQQELAYLSGQWQDANRAYQAALDQINSLKTLLT